MSLRRDGGSETVALVLNEVDRAMGTRKGTEVDQLRRRHFVKEVFPAKALAEGNEVSHAKEALLPKESTLGLRRRIGETGYGRARVPAKEVNPEKSQHQNVKITTSLALRHEGDECRMLSGPSVSRLLKEGSQVFWVRWTPF